MSDNAIINILILKQLAGIGNATINDISDYLDSDTETVLNAVFKKTKHDLPESAIDEAKTKAETLLKDYSEGKFDIITYQDNEYYPKVFFELGNQKPPLLFIKGNKELLRKEMIAVIGTRKPSEKTKDEGPKLIKKIAAERKDEVIVSGLALGCDEIAHKTALEENIPTIAVLPSGFDAIIPKKHTILAHQIATCKNGLGCLISEYAPNEDAKDYTYLARDKLIAALAKRIVVLECGIPSGTMHAVKKGKELKIPIGVSSDSFDGNKLIITKYGGIDISNDDEFKKFIDNPTATKEETQTKLDLFNS